jgi:fructokinase
VVGIGEVLWDIYRQGRYPGGTPSNFAIHATQLGDHGVLVSRVGDDGMGRELLAALKQKHLPTRYVQVDPLHGTGNVMISLDVQGVPSFRCSNDVAFDYLQHDEQNQVLAASADAVLFSTLAQRSPQSRRAVHHFLRGANRAVKILEVNSQPPARELRALLHESLALADVLKTNGAGMTAVRLALRREDDKMRRFVEFLIKKFSLKLVALTHGESGCELFTEQQTVKVEGLPVRVVDTTGAGDAFAAGLVHKFLRGAPLQETAEYANLLGAFLAMQHGATPVFSPAQVEALRESLS